MSSHNWKPHIDPRRWGFVDVRLNKDMTYDILFHPRSGQPTPLLDEHFRYPMPMIERENIKDVNRAHRHATIFDMFFGHRKASEEPDYKSHLEYLKTECPPAFETLTRIARGEKVENPTIPQTGPEKDFSLQQDQIKQEKPKRRKVNRPKPRKQEFF